MRPVAPPREDAEIVRLLREVRAGDLDPYGALEQLGRIARTAPPPLAGEARFRAVQLRLEQDDPYAGAAARALLAAQPDHALVPHLHFWLAGWQARRGAIEAALSRLALAVDAPGADPELRRQALQAAFPLLRRQADGAAVDWLLARLPALDDDALRREVAQAAALRSDPERVARLHDSGMLRDARFAPYYLELARLALMRGDHDLLDRIADWAARDLPPGPALRMIRRWRSGTSRPVRIGVLLPLSGRYAGFGRQALRGIRMSVAQLRYGERISLQVEDSQSTPEGTRAGYRRLLDGGCVAVIGPLAGDDVEALAVAGMRPDVPVIALTNRIETAALAPPLFVHSVGPLAQAAFWAERWRWRLAGGAVRPKPFSDGAAPQVAVIEGPERASAASAELFSRRLRQAGVVVHRLTIQGGVDVRRQLMALRRESDDGMLLDALDEELALFIAEQDLRPVLPPRLAAIYLPLPGRTVVQLAGQLAYVGLNRVPLLGDSRWRDGHLLDDHGRDLESARIAEVPDRLPGAEDTPLDLRYRELWGEGARTVLADVAFDSLRVAATLTSSWGLEGFALLRALRDPGGFPLATGRVVFDRRGVGHKQFALLAVRDGALRPVAAGVR